MNIWKIKSYGLLVVWLASGCAFMSDSTVKKQAPTGLIATPESYYSTAKARYLGSKYKDNLDRLTERIVRNSTTSQLQFANNISSVGGIGFFTHSATKTPDERYLEVVLAMPETFETKGEYSDKVSQLFSRYGYDLLSILAGDSEIYEDKELAGYGLNLTWRNVISDSPANRVILARSIIYFRKEQVANFVRRKLSGNELLGDAVIFAVEDDGPLNLVSYQPREIKPDFRPAIREDNLAAGTPVGKSSTAPQSGAEAAKTSGEKLEARADAMKKDMPVAQAPNPRTTGTQSAGESPQVNRPASQALDALVSQSVEDAKIAEQPAPVKLDAGPEKITRAQQPVEARSIKPVPEMVLPIPAPPNLSEPALKLERPKDTGKAPVAAAAPIAKAEPAKLPSEKKPPEPQRAENAAAKPLADSAKQTPSPRAEITLPQKPAEAPAAETQNSESQSKRAENREKPAVANLAPKPASVPEVPKLQEDKSAEIAVTPSPVAETPAPRSVERKVPAIVPPMAKPETREPGIEAAPSAVASTSKEASKAPQKPAAAPGIDAAKQALRPEIAPAPIAKSPAPVEVKPAETAKAPVEEKKIETKSRTIGAPPVKIDAPADVAVAPEPVRAAEVKRPEIVASRPTVEKPVETPVARKAEAAAPLPVAKTEARETSKPAPVPVVAPNQGRVVPAAEPIKVTEVKRPEVAAAPPPTEKPAEMPAANKTEPAPPPTLIAKTEVREMNKPAAPAPVIASKQDRIVAAPAPEQLALARTPIAPSVESAPLARPAPKPLQGFIIQVAFADKQKAQSWAEKMTQRGYAVSVTEAGAEGALRVRLGNFSLRDEAERQLQSFKQEGMNGIIINLPQAFRPEARSSLP